MRTKEIQMSTEKSPVIIELEKVLKDGGELTLKEISKKMKLSYAQLLSIISVATSQIPIYEEFDLELKKTVYGLNEDVEFKTFVDL